MNIERGVHIPKTHLTSDYTADKLWEFADVLASHRWGQTKTQQVGIERAIIEVLGDEYTIRNEEEKVVAEVEPIYTEVMIGFEAMKHTIEDDNGYEYTAPYYRLTNTVTQDISADEIPDHILKTIEDMIVDGHEEGDVGVGDLIDGSPIKEAQELFGLEGKSSISETMQMMDIDRRQSVSYELDHEGEIQAYLVAYGYCFDGQPVFEMTYRRNEDEENAWVLLKGANNTYRDEKRPAIVRVLTEQNIDAEVREIDQDITEFFQELSLREAIEMGGASKEEHLRRVLGMLSLLSGGFIKTVK